MRIKDDATYVTFHMEQPAGESRSDPPQIIYQHAIHYTAGTVTVEPFLAVLPITPR